MPPLKKNKLFHSLLWVIVFVIHSPYRGLFRLSLSVNKHDQHLRAWASSIHSEHFESALACLQLY